MVALNLAKFQNPTVIDDFRVANGFLDNGERRALEARGGVRLTMATVFAEVSLATQASGGSNRAPDHTVGGSPSWSALAQLSRPSSGILCGEHRRAGRLREMHSGAVGSNEAVPTDSLRARSSSKVVAPRSRSSTGRGSGGSSRHRPASPIRTLARFSPAVGPTICSARRSRPSSAPNGRPGWTHSVRR